MMKTAGGKIISNTTGAGGSTATRRPSTKTINMRLSASASPTTAANTSKSYNNNSTYNDKDSNSKTSSMTTNSYVHNVTTFSFIVGLLVGYVLGREGGGDNSGRINSGLRTKSSTATTKGLSSFVTHINDAPTQSTSHVDPTTGTAILKQQLIDPFVVIPNLAGISVATLRQDQTVTSHHHETMHEFFYVLEGHGIFTIQDTNYTVHPGSFVHIVPPDVHSISVAVKEENMDVEGDEDGEDDENGGDNEINYSESGKEDQEIEVDRQDSASSSSNQNRKNKNDLVMVVIGVTAD
jgi:quercetin dioxygenase-like cupin family protein